MSRPHRDRRRDGPFDHAAESGDFDGLVGVMVELSHARDADHRRFDVVFAKRRPTLNALHDRAMAVADVPRILWSSNVVTPRMPGCCRPVGWSMLRDAISRAPTGAPLCYVWQADVPWSLLVEPGEPSLMNCQA